MWIRSEERWSSIRRLQPAFPGFPVQINPVTDCGVLAYSCAAAREFHPLPVALAFRQPTIMREPDVEKEQNSSPANLLAIPNKCQSQMEGRVSWVPG